MNKSPPLYNNPELNSMSSRIFTPIMEDLTLPMDDFPGEASFIEASIAKLDQYNDQVRGNMITLAQRDIEIVKGYYTEPESHTFSHDPGVPLLPESDYRAITTALNTPAGVNTKLNLQRVPIIDITVNMDLPKRDHATRTALILAEKLTSQLNGFREHGKKVKLEWEEELFEAKQRAKQTAMEDKAKAKALMLGKQLNKQYHEEKGKRAEAQNMEVMQMNIQAQEEQEGQEEVESKDVEMPDALYVRLGIRGPSLM